MADTNKHENIVISEMILGSSVRLLKGLIFLVYVYIHKQKYKLLGDKFTTGYKHHWQARSL